MKIILKPFEYILMPIFILLAVALDQVTKYLVVENIPLHSRVPAIEGLFGLTYVQNTGAAFSSFQGMRWLFVLIFLGVTVLVIWELFHNSMGFTRLEWWFIASIFAGGLGNVIDRVRQGFVVDMVELQFISFPIFNVADCFITCGSVLLIVHLLFFNKSTWKGAAQ